MRSSKKNAAVIGALFLLGILTYGVGSGLVASVVDAPDFLTNGAANATPATFGALLMVLNSVAMLGVGALLYAVVKPLRARVALLYLCARIAEAVLLLLGVVALLALLAVRRDAATTAELQPLLLLCTKLNFYAYQLAMLVLGLGSLLFCRLLFTAALVPKALAINGLIGYGLLAAGAVCELFGLSIGVLLSIPGGLFELIFAVLLLTKGLKQPVEVV